MFAACATEPKRPEVPAGLSGRSVLIEGGSAEQRAQAAREIAPFSALFLRLHNALDDHDHTAASQILSRIRARNPQGAALERALAFERILFGRQFSSLLDLRLVAERASPEEAAWMLYLVGEHDLADDVQIRTGPPRLEALLVGVDALGAEQRYAQSQSVPSLDGFALPANSKVRIDLGRFEFPQTAALALRSTWRLDFPSGEVVVAGRPYPAMFLEVQPAEAVLLAPYLPTDPVEPSELVSYVDGKRFAMPPMMERAVRIPLDRRGEALDLLTDVVQRMPRAEVEQLTPALRWLSGHPSLGRDASGWRRFLSLRRASGSPQETAALDLPDEVLP